MNKQNVKKLDLLKQLVQILQQEIDATLVAVNEAHALASHEQSKPENQYDTLALEAAYLAHGQSTRIADLQRQVMLLNRFEFSEVDDNSRITTGALVQIKNTNGLEAASWLWLLPVAGGIVLSPDSENKDCNKDCNKEDEYSKANDIRTITSAAPLAQKLVGRYLGDEIELTMGVIKKQFEIIELL